MSQLRHTSDAAARLGIPERTLRQWRYLGVGPKYVKLGSSVRYRDEDLDDYIAEHLVETRSA